MNILVKIFSVCVAVYAINSIAEEKVKYAFENMNPLHSSEVIEYIENGERKKPLFILFTRDHLNDENKLTDEIAKEYADEFEFAYTYIPSMSMSAFRNIEPLTKKYKFSTLPAALILDGERLLSKADLITQRKYPKKYYLSRIKAALENLDGSGPN